MTGRSHKNQVRNVSLLISSSHWNTQHKDERKRAVFCHVYAALLDYFKALMTPYMSFMIQAFTDLLESFTGSEEQDPELWGSLVQAIGKSFEVDEAGMSDLFFISCHSLSQLPTRK